MGVVLEPGYIVIDHFVLAPALEEAFELGRECCLLSRGIELLYTIDRCLLVDEASCIGR